ncbi:hypothetical protein WISP_14478 [Willisornis vidua]|uniref:Uncharacterized protein n=1 Tax=Willisornis vidua TaxID=1566151 RepID=A0ABQ9DQB3_9PASS|nr:hypothetical protein WISP_14478 [Willisornis vidua]
MLFSAKKTDCPHYIVVQQSRFVFLLYRQAESRRQPLTMEIASYLQNICRNLPPQDSMGIDIILPPDRNHKNAEAKPEIEHIKCYLDLLLTAKVMADVSPQAYLPSKTILERKQMKGSNKIIESEWFGLEGTLNII